MAFNILLGLVLGSFGFVVASDGALGWTVYPLASEGTGANVRLRDVAYGHGKFVAVTETGDTYLATASEPHLWTPGASIPGAALEVIKFVNGRFAAVGRNPATGNGLFLSSMDGTNWTRQEFETAPRGWRDVAWGNGWYVLAGESGLSKSTDGVDWMIDTNFAGVLVRSVNFLNGEFLAVFWEAGSFPSSAPSLERQSSGGSLSLAVSQDGADWRAHALWGESYGPMVYGRKTYVSFGNTDVTSSGWGWFSADGRTWERADFPRGADGSAVAYGNGVFVISGLGGTGPSTFLSSTNGMTWEDFPIGSRRSFLGLAFGNGRFVAVGYDWNDFDHVYGLVAVSESVGSLPRLLNLRVSVDAIEFDFSAENQTEWDVEASGDLIDWTVVRQIEGTGPELRRISLPRSGQTAWFLRLREKG